MTCNIILVSGVQTVIQYFIHYEMIMVILVTICHHIKYFNTNDYIPYDVHYISMIYFFCNRNFYLLISFTYFAHLPIPAFLPTTSLFYLWFCFWYRREEGKTQPLKESRSHWEHGINWLESTTQDGGWFNFQ